MKNMRRLLTVLSFAWIIPGTQAETVFDNLTGASLAFFGPGCCQIGDEIVLGGTAREVTRLKFGVSTQGVDLVAVIEMAIYANDGPGGSPGTLLWRSGPLTGLPVPANATEIAVEVPSIAVPDVITVTSILAAAPIALGRLEPTPPAIGSFDRAWIENAPGVWGRGFGFAVQVDAVPEPPSNVLMITALLGGLVLASTRAGRTKSAVHTRVTSP